jgi:hypothetical protein
MSVVKSFPHLRPYTNIHYVSFVLLGCPSYILSTPEPNISDYVPIDDEAWDQQVCFIGRKIVTL